MEGNIIAFPDAAARPLRRRPLRPSSPYYFAQLRYLSSVELMVRFALGFIEGRGSNPSYPVRLALSAVDGFLSQTPKFCQAWARDGRDHHMVQFLVAANRHGCWLRGALERLRATEGIAPENISEIHKELESIGAYVEGVLETTLTVLPVRS